MNLTNLFEAQKELGKVGLFNYRGPDRFNKLVLALLVEIGECANEWRGFKFWSQNQLPCTLKSRRPYMNFEDADFYNPLLEEYVDGLHFVLEIGLEIKVNQHEYAVMLEENVTEQFQVVFYWISNLPMSKVNQRSYYIKMVRWYLGLGELLGFTWEQIEQAYFDKNKINHLRQEQGY